MALVYAYAGPEHAYVYVCLRTHAEGFCGLFFFVFSKNSFI